MALIQIGLRPLSLDGCVATWTEKQLPNIIRTSMENLTVKVRRRTTGIMKQISCTVNLKAEVYKDFMEWFNIDCQSGVLPTRIKHPMDGTEIVVRFREAPQIEWLDKKVFKVSMELEQMPGWDGLPPSPIPPINLGPAWNRNLEVWDTTLWIWGENNA